MKQRVGITRQKLRKYYYRPNISAQDTAKYFNCSPTTIKNYLVKYGFRVKRRSEVMRGRRLSDVHKEKVVKNLRNFKGGKV